MSATLFVLVPIGMLAVVWSLCFVGACFQTHGLASPYSDNVVVDPNLVAYWPLSDLIGPPLNTPAQTSGATDFSGNHHDGTYTIPPSYPSAPANSKPIANPSVARGASIIPGDSGSTKNPFPASADFEGGYVSIPWSTQNSPQLPSFTLEAWVKPNWTGSGFYWVVFGGVTDTTGFGVYINASNLWELTIGNGTALTTVTTSVSIDPTSSTPTYVAVTCDKNGNLALWINPLSQSDLPNPPPPTPNWTSPGSTGYVAADPTQPVTFFIGAGAPQLALRTQPGGTGAPLFPFQGLIQSVALYSAVLDPTTLQTHFTNGMD